MTQMQWEAVIGLEIHVELKTASKLFCACAAKFGGKPNTQCCPVCLGLPGSLPVLNKKALEYGITAGLSLGCTIAAKSKFDRKHYFYPDLPKAYQISQYDEPLAVSGRVELEADGRSVSVGITRVHLEEEAGKSVHSGDSIIGSSYSSVDYNRAGIPLIEIVTEPDLRSPEEARAFLDELKQRLQYTGVSDCKMEEGSLRCDANVSLRPRGSADFGTKVEVKNMNSFRSVERALRFEVGRQEEMLGRGGAVVQETRAWDERREITVSMRSKEDSHDYRYFPDGDLPRFAAPESLVTALRRQLPEMPQAKRARLQKQYGLSDYEAAFLASDQLWADFFEEAAGLFSRTKLLVNWIMGDVSRLVNEGPATIAAAPLTPAYLADLLVLLEREVISGPQAKTVLEEIFASGRSPSAIVAALGLEQISDDSSLEQLLADVLSRHPDEVARLKTGDMRLLGFFVGQVLQASQGRANPKKVSELLRTKLGLA